MRSFDRICERNQSQCLAHARCSVHQLFSPLDLVCRQPASCFPWPPGSGVDFLRTHYSSWLPSCPSPTSCPPWSHLPFASCKTLSACRRASVPAPRKAVCLCCWASDCPQSDPARSFPVSLRPVLMSLSLTISSASRSCTFHRLSVALILVPHSLWEAATMLGGLRFP